jgi:hypothetical protein
MRVDIRRNLCYIGRQEDCMKKIVMEKDQDVVFIDEIDNSSIVGMVDGTTKYFLCYVGMGKNSHKEKHVFISFRKHCDDSNHIFGGPKSSKRKNVKYMISHFPELCIYLFDSKRELFEWGLEGLED